MALPILIRLPAAPDPLTMTLPGGVTMHQQDLLKVIQPALTPLMPVFNILDAVIAVFNTVKAIPESLGPPPDPTKLVSAVVEMTKKVSKLLRLVPQLSLPYTIIGVIDVILDALTQVRDRLVFLQVRSRGLAQMTQRSVELNDAGLAAIAECTRLEPRTGSGEHAQEPECSWHAPRLARDVLVDDRRPQSSEPRVALGPFTR